MNLSISLKAYSYRVTIVLKSKVQTVLKSTKHLHEHNIYMYLLIYAHACILRASLCKKARYCERNFDVCLVIIGIKDV